MKKIVISAVNFSEGGPLTVLRDCINFATKTLGDDWEIIALVHKSELISNPRVQCIEFPEIKTSWAARIRLEYWGFKALSLQLQPDLWLSLHDMSPRVHARRQAVYCHNPAPFYQLSLREARLEPTLAIFNWFYKYLYRINIHSNTFVIVQQDWIRREFQRLYGLQEKVLVAHPNVNNVNLNVTNISPPLKNKMVFFYPALPRVFKNIEVLCQAITLLPIEIRNLFELRITIDGHENPYAKELYQRFAHLNEVRFLGRQSREQMQQQYAESDVVMFPSKLETWGLPITEAKTLAKALVVAELPYARETVGEYQPVSFLPPNNPMAWAQTMESLVLGRHSFQGNASSVPTEPFAADWHQLWLRLTEGL